ncbi:MAG: ATP synthase F1 subunit gamma [Candidatus Wildermuthbacteria bacterium]|nr:ATP synthase F1 subunit gamma [Candidatus Wildermuthbacteria bacterium]
MASKLQIKGKITATRNIRQITKAMQMVAASKMRKAQEAALRARPYAKKAASLLRNILRYVSKTNHTHSLFEKRGKKNLCLAVATSDKGLCGAFNGNVLRAAMKFLRDHEDCNVDIVAVGRKGRDFFKKRNIRAVREFLNFSEQASSHDAHLLFEWLYEKYAAKEYDRVFFCSTSFLSVLQQKVELYQLLPLSVKELNRLIANIVPKTGKYSEFARNDEPSSAHYYLFEPSAKEILEQVMRFLASVQVFHLLLESNASEHSARMVAMKNASENAERILEELSRTLNTLRQTSITQELAEITTAKEALTAE